MRPKPKHTAYREQLCRVLTTALDRARPTATWPWRDRNACLTLVSWTVHFYDEHRDIGLDLPGIEQLLAQPLPSECDRREIDAFGRRLSRLWRFVGDTLPVMGRVIAKPDLKRTMNEAARYQHDEGGIGTTIRDMLKAAIEDAWRRGERILLIGHSLGSVIAYDALWELSHAKQGRQPPASGHVDLFLTLGSPLASRFVRRRLAGRAYQGPKRYPTLVRRWENFAARSDMTAFRPALRPYFREMVDLGLVADIVGHAGIIRQHKTIGLAFISPA